MFVFNNVSTTYYDLDKLQIYAQAFYWTWLDFFQSAQWTAVWYDFKIVSVAGSVFLLFLIIMLGLKTNWLQDEAGLLAASLKAPAKAVKKTQSRWEKIAVRAEKNNDSERKLAVIEADKFFDKILLRIGYQGQSLGDRLKQLKQLPMINDLWYAHKIRNEIVHNPDYALSQSDARSAVNVYAEALRYLQVLN